MSPCTPSLIRLIAGEREVRFLVVKGGVLSGSHDGSGMRRGGQVAGVHWMWFPTMVMVGVGLLLGWVLFGRK